jgi:multidrug efflux system membrane fusion protein
MRALPLSHVTLCAGLLALGSAFALGGCDTRAAAPPPPRPAIVIHPQAGEEARAEIYSGELRARFESQLGFRVAGKIRARRVDVGAKVTAGQVLAELDPLDLQLQVTSAQAALASARANRDLAQSEFNRYRALLDKHYISQTQFDTQANALKAAQAQVAQAEAALAVARNQAEYAALRADAAGTITAIGAEAGQVVAAGQPIATLARDGAIEVEIAVPENRVADYRVGRPAVVEPWAAGGQRLNAHLREIAPEADRASRTYRVRVALDESAPALRLGQTARVVFAGDADPRESVVPLAALDRQADQAAVWVLDPRTRQVHPRSVRVRDYREHGVVLDETLDGALWIVAAGVHKLHDGEVIAPVDARNRPLAL